MTLGCWGDTFREFERVKNINRYRMNRYIRLFKKYYNLYCIESNQSFYYTDIVDSINVLKMANIFNNCLIRFPHDANNYFKIHFDLTNYKLDNLVEIGEGRSDYKIFSLSTYLYRRRSYDFLRLKANEQDVLISNDLPFNSYGKIIYKNFFKLDWQERERVIENPNLNELLLLAQKDQWEDLKPKRIVESDEYIKIYEEAAKSALSDMDIVFKREYSVKNKKGNFYRVDFYISDLDVFLEIDEKHHEFQKEADAKRQAYIEQKTGKKVYRIKAKTKKQVYKDVQKLVNEFCLS